MTHLLRLRPGSHDKFWINDGLKVLTAGYLSDHLMKTGNFDFNPQVML
jgi:hypothetical protein